MKATQMETDWLVKSESNKEELAFTHFLKVHEHISFSTSSDEPETLEPIVPIWDPGQPEAELPSPGYESRQGEPPHGTDRDSLDDL